MLPAMRHGLIFVCTVAATACVGMTACGDDANEVIETPPAGSTGSGNDTETPATDSGGPSDDTTDPPATDDGTGDTTAADGTTTGLGEPGQVIMETNLGTMVIELDEEAAPVTSANFLAYVNAGFYDGTDGMGATTFHRVVPGFVIQGGGLTQELGTKTTMDPIVNESGNGLLNTRGTLSMARTADPDSATSQFFVNLVDNDFLDKPPGYAVFAEVVEGMDVVDAIAAVATTDMPPYEDVPVDPVIIMSVTVVE